MHCNTRYIKSTEYLYICQWIFGSLLMKIWIFVNDILFNSFCGSSHYISFLKQLSIIKWVTVAEFQDKFVREVCDLGVRHLPRVGFSPQYYKMRDSGRSFLQWLVWLTLTFWPVSCLAFTDMTPHDLMFLRPLPYFVSFKMWWKLCQLPGLKPMVLQNFAGRGA